MLSKIFLLILLISCSSRHEDPLKNTKKLIKEGHGSLYNNGAFSIPATKIKLIPPGPSALEFAKELSGLRAKESFLKYLNEVRAATVTIYEGTKKSYRFSKDVDQKVSESLSELGPKLKENSIVIMNSTQASSKSIIAKSWAVKKQVEREIRKVGREIKKSLGGMKITQRDFKSMDDFILGYAELPKKLETRKTNIKSSASLKKFVDNFKETEEFRRASSDATTYLINESVDEYANNVSDSFANAKTDLRKSDEFGYSFALLRSLVWVLDGVLWQGIVKPIGKISAGAIGYTVLNGVAYPIYLISKNGVTTAQIAVEITTEAGLGFYELTAPTVELALSSLLYSGEFLANKTIEKSSQATGFIMGNSLEYIGAPVGSTLVGLAGATSGVAVGVGGGILSGSTRGAGEVLSLSSNVISKTSAGVVFTGGVVAHTLKGTGEVVYEITKASIVPPSMVLGSGIALSYGTVSQLAAQTVLTVTDAAYLVLSLEGPNWVVYAVSGRLGDKDLPEGTVLDLEKMQSQGEEIKKVPVSDEEMENLIKFLNGEVPAPQN